jgi:DNA-dependent RNA polymerase auxiliary subunit epsilon
VTGQRETTCSLVIDGFIPRHQVRQYLRALNIEWVEESLPGDKVTFRFEATDTQWSDVQAWVEKVTT